MTFKLQCNVLGSWNTVLKTCGISKQLLYANGITGGRAPLESFSMAAAGYQKNQGMIKGLEISTPHPSASGEGREAED